MQRVAMEEARRKMQMKYNEEAEVAAKKQEEVSNNQFQVLQFHN
jgi:hypothetical protein